VEEVTLLNDLALGGGGLGGGVGLGYLAFRLMNSKSGDSSNGVLTQIAEKIDRSNELLQDLAVEIAEMKGLLANFRRD
tara:strand:- start:963 stop:1196 length:234 start_codon:yes stop_codon:yes gene_type:complete